MTPSAPQDPQVPPAVYNSLGLQALLDRIEEDREYEILDLGRALEANLRFWSQFSCRLHVHDFYRTLLGRKGSVGLAEEAAEPDFSALLAFGEDTVFDFVLAWDLFNYLELGELEALARGLSRRCRPGTRLFALISSLPRISASPIMFRILNREQLSYELPSQRTRPCPCHTPRDIARLMGRFTVSRSFLSRHGIQEYVFAFE